MTTISDPQRFERAIALFDAANAEDPNKEAADGQEWPKELLYGQRMSEMLERFAPDAPEAVRLACRAQHIERWKSPRSDYPMTLDGYQQWRTSLYKFHANRAGELMKEAGYDDETGERGKKSIGKRGLKEGVAEAQVRSDGREESSPLDDAADRVAAILAELGALGSISSRSRRAALWQVSGLPASREPLFAGIPREFQAVRYHSLCVEQPLPDELRGIAWTSDGVLMAVEHRERPLWGVQFHPESVLTDTGKTLLRNFLSL